MRPADLPQAVVATNVSQEQVLLRNLINIIPGVKAPINFGVYSDTQKMVVWQGLQVLRKSKMLVITVDDQPGEDPAHRAARQVALDRLFDGLPVVAHAGGEHDDTWDRERAGAIAKDNVPVVTPPKDPDVAGPQTPAKSTLQDPDVNPLVKPAQVEQPTPLPPPPAPDGTDPFAAL